MSGVAPFAVRDLLSRALASRRIPVAGNFELTWECNLRCDHCYLGEDRRRRELSTDEVLRILDELAAAGTLMLTLTGGEVLLRRDFSLIYRHAHAAGFLLSVFTNGLLLRGDVLELLTQHPPRAIEVSLYGLSDAHYRQFAHRNVRFAQLDANLREVTAHGLPLVLKTVATRTLGPLVPAMRNYAQGLGATFRFATTVYDAHDQTLLAGTERPTTAQTHAYELYAAPELRPSPSHTDSRVFSCGAGRVSFNIDPEGVLSRCGMVRGPAGAPISLREVSVAEGWQHLGLGLDAHFEPHHPCHSCSIRHLCHRCPATTDAQTQIDMCEAAYRRAHAAGLVPAVTPPLARYLTPEPAALVQIQRRPRESSVHAQE